MSDVSKQFNEIVGHPDLREVSERGSKAVQQHAAFNRVVHDQLHESDDRIHELDHLADANDDAAHPRVDMAIEADRNDESADWSHYYHLSHLSYASSTNPTCIHCNKVLYAHPAAPDCPTRAGGYKGPKCRLDTENFNSYGEYFEDE